MEKRDQTHRYYKVKGANMKINFYVVQWDHFYEKYSFANINEKQLQLLVDLVVQTGIIGIRDCVFRLRIPYERSQCKEAYIMNRGMQVTAVLNKDHPYAIEYLS